MSNRNEKLIGKIFLEGQLQTLTQLSIGSGESTYCDQEVIKLYGLPYIPASAMTGVLKEAFLKSFSGKIENLEPYFWGSMDSNAPFKSHIMFDNALLTKPEDFELTILDGIEIVPETNQVKKGSKYDYEVLEPGATFNFRAEISIHKNFSFQKMISYADHCLQWLKSDRLQVGSMTTAGLGKIQGEEIKMYVYDFLNDNKAVDAYFNYLRDGKHQILKYAETVENYIKLPKENTFNCTAIFNIKSKLITATETIHEDADAIQINRKGGEYYITGKSLKGSIKHRISKIHKTLRGEVKALRDLFGYEGDDNNNASKARFYTEESIIAGAKVALQQRTKIDRFSGGTINEALFNSMPVEQASDKCLKIKVNIKDPTKNDIFLTLQAFKDLMTEDLAIGGGKSIGRGVLVGSTLKATHEKEELFLDMQRNKNELSEYFKNLKYDNATNSK